MYKKLKQEIIDTIPAIIYFCIAFNLIHFTEGLFLSTGYIRLYSYFTVTLAGLIMGKVLIILNCFSFINAFPQQPLIYNITWKFFIYSISVLIIRILDVFLHTSFMHKSFIVGYQIVRQQIIHPVFWGTQMWLTIVFLVFVIFSEFVQRLGKDQVKEMLFGAKK